MTSLAKPTWHGSQQRDASLSARLLSFVLAPLAPLYAAFAILRVQILLALADIINFFSGANKRRADNVFLQGNYAPIYKQAHEENLPVEGKLPQALDGVFVR